MTVHTTLFGMRDVEEGDQIVRLPDGGIVLRNNGTDHHMTFENLAEYARWLDRNADRLGEPKLVRLLSKGLLGEPLAGLVGALTPDERSRLSEMLRD